MTVHVLKTTNEKVKGVIGKKDIDLNDIYLFTSIEPKTAFHMKGVVFPIKIAFLDKNFGIISIEDMEPDIGNATAPEDTCYAVEVHPEYFSKNSLKSGDFWLSLSNHMMNPKY